MARPMPVPYTMVPRPKRTGPHLSRGSNSLAEAIAEYESASLGANAEIWLADRRPLSNSRLEYRSARNGQSSEKWSGGPDSNRRSPAPKLRAVTA
jgi:hypothetical protein